MIRALILYYLSIKATHGYDIQRFVEVNGMDAWANIQSGSIYYALGKLEKDGCIYTLREERTGARVRKIYAIADKGRDELNVLLKEEFTKPIHAVESDKFILYTMVNRLSKEDLTQVVKEHIAELKDKKHWWECGKKLKLNEKSLNIDRLNFEMVISNLGYQIEWNEMLLEEIDKVYSYSDGVETIIKNMDFSSMENVDYKDTQNKNFVRVESLKSEIINDPTNIAEKIDELIRLIKE